MGALAQKGASRLKRKTRIRTRVSGTPARPRLTVFRSASHIYVQIVDDLAGCTLVSASTLNGEVKGKVTGKKKLEQAKLVGALVAQRAKQAGIEKVVFDRNGFLYHGRVAALAAAARENGLEF
jgi:large subunit ribosomal protein L18